MLGPNPVTGEMGRTPKPYHKTPNEQVGKSLEAATAEHLLGQMCGEDPRYLSIPADAVERLTLEDVKSAIMSRLTTDNIELSISGDINPAEVNNLSKNCAFEYLHPTL